MKTHRELVDGYLDASWALAMEKVAMRQGELAGELEKRLEQDPGAAVPRRTVKRCRAAIRKAFSQPVRRVKTVLARVVIAAVLCGLLTTVACAISPDFKAFLTRIFYSVTETFTSFALRDPQVENVAGMQGNTDQMYNGLRFEWLPEGYEYVDGQETERLRRVEFENKMQDYIWIRVTNTDESSAYTYDSEVDTPIPVQIGELEGWLSVDGTSTSLFWVDDQQDKAIMILATNLPQEEILQLARALHVK